MPNRYTEFVLPDQEEADLDHYSSGGEVDGNEYLITSSLIAPNSRLDTDRTDTCKYYDEHEIFSSNLFNAGGSSGFTQLAMIIDASGSIGSIDFSIITGGIADAIENVDTFPHDGSVELTIIKFSNGANLEINSPIIVDNSNYQTIANNIRNIAYVGGGTAMSDAFALANTTLYNSPNFNPNDRQLINIVTDGEPNSPTNTISERDGLISNLGMDLDPKDEIDAEAIGLYVDPIWLRDNIVWPQPGNIVTTPPFEAGWVRVVETVDDFAPAVGEKFESLFNSASQPRYVFEFDANDGTGLYINKDDTGIPPNCDCGGPYTAGVEDEVIMLDGCDSSDPDGYIVSYQWTIGTDVYTSSSCQYYLALGNYGPGTYPVELCVTDNDGYKSYCQTTLTIGEGANQPPNSDCGGRYNAGVEDVAIMLDGCDSYDPDGTIVNYEWEVDGTTVYSGPSCSYSLPLSSYYAEGSPYTVDLTVTDNDDSTDTCSTTLTIGGLQDLMVISIDDITICCDETEGKAYILASNLQEVIKVEINITWTSELVMLDYDFNFDFGTSPPVKEGSNYLNFEGMCNTATYTTGLTGDFIIGWIEFGALTSGPDTAYLEFESCSLKNITSFPGYLGTDAFKTIDGTVTIGDPPLATLGDMDGNGYLEFDDVVLLAMHLNNPLYSLSELADGDVTIDEDGNPSGPMGDACDFDDVVLLAMYLNFPTLYEIYPQM